MVSFEKFFNNFLWLGLFVFLAMAFVFTIQSDNRASQPMSDDPDVATLHLNLSQNFGSSENDSKEQYSIFTNEKPSPSLGSIVLFTIVGVAQTFGSIVVGTLLILIKLPLLVLGIDSSISAIIMTWLSISIVLGLWIVYKFGG